MNMFARFDENPAMTLQVIKKKKKNVTAGQTHGQRENSIPHHKQSLRGYNDKKVVTILRIKKACLSGPMSLLFDWL